jgi:hypothetical protein
MGGRRRVKQNFDPLAIRLFTGVILRNTVHPVMEEEKYRTNPLKCLPL